MASLGLFSDKVRVLEKPLRGVVKTCDPWHNS